MSTHAISDNEFVRVQRFIYEAAGITLSPGKKALVTARWAKRLQAHQCQSYAQYLQLLTSGQAPDESQVAIDLLTTNETYFFREAKHFELLRELTLAARQRSAPSFRVWSAASSSGEEAYSAAMVLADCLGEVAWEVFGSDISTRVLARARTGLYPMERAARVPLPYLKRFCLKGTGEYEGTLLVDPALRSRVQFRQVNLNGSLPPLAAFDVIFLRNVMIYFNNETKSRVVTRLASMLKPDGHFLIGHSETLNGINESLELVAPGTYRLPGREKERGRRWKP